jgi:thiol-disulfide isomerase/thioredoxin
VAIPAHSPRKGPKAAKVTIVAFSDFQCPFCSRAVPILKEIEEKYPKDVALVFVNQPLSFQDKAMGAAQAFMAAARQGKAWEMHDKMFANQQALAPADLESTPASSSSTWRASRRTSTIPSSRPTSPPTRRSPPRWAPTARPPS